MNISEVDHRLENYLMGIADSIVALTTECRDNMHEPDEQGITGRVVGRFGFDNVCGLSLDEVGTLRESETDLHLVLSKMDKPVETYNLADLIAVIRYLRARVDLKKGALRVWYIRNIPASPIYYAVATPELAAFLIDEMAMKDLDNPRVESNAFGLEVWDGTEWAEWFTDTGDDIHEYSEWLESEGLMFAVPA